MKEPMPSRVTNIARDQATVYVQAGNVQAGQIGNVQMGATSLLSLADQIAGLRQDLDAALSRGAIDPPTFAAADEELSKAAEYSSDRSPGAGDKLILALKRLKGLVDGIADLGAKVATIIAVVLHP